jgi:alcohol dehydrogenase class IV
MQFEFATATRIVFGPGKLREAGSLAKSLGRCALVVTGRTAERAGPMQEVLKQAGIETVLFPVAGEPEIQTVEEGVAVARQNGSDLVVSLGGGSAIDTGKAIAAMLANEGALLDYLEVIGRGKTLAKASAPFIAIPTTAGTGSEVTRNAVLGSRQHRVKVSLRSPHMLPRAAIVDPELTYDLPPSVTASTGLDALTQLIEPYVSSRANPMTDSLCVEGMQRASRALRRAYEHPEDRAAREEMCVASLFGGLALANAGLGAVHGFAGPIGGMFSAPHGAICAALLPHVVETNIRALERRESGSPHLQRLGDVARLLTGTATATANDGVAWVRSLVSALNIPKLAAYGIRSSDLPELVEKASKASSMKANPIVLTPEELSATLESAL